MVLWYFDRGWRPWFFFRERDAITFTKSSDFLKISGHLPYFPFWSFGATAIGLLNEDGFGPIVILPFWNNWFEVTFIAKAIGLRASDRWAAGTGERVPVAMVQTGWSAGDDMLSALSGATGRMAEGVWQEASEELNFKALKEDPRLIAQRKFVEPAPALLASHFLLRFMPEQLPKRWANNLRRAAPEAADGPVIAAWRLLASGKDLKGSPDRLKARLADLANEALARPVTYYSRTRGLLVDLLRYVPEPNPGQVQRLQSFRRYGADAGGFDCFWGASPTQPGETGKSHYDASYGLQLRDFQFC